MNREFTADSTALIEPIFGSIVSNSNKKPKITL